MPHYAIYVLHLPIDIKLDIQSSWRNGQHCLLSLKCGLGAYQCVHKQANIVIERNV